MSDVQTKRRMVIKRLLAVSVFLFLLSGGMLYYKYSTDAEYAAYQTEVSQESGLQSQVNAAQSVNNELLAKIEENGQKLQTLEDDKAYYVNWASNKALTNNVRINKLVVSDIWQDGEMSGMTTVLEVEGLLSDIQGFLSDYCGKDNVNRASAISCRPNGRYPWLTRNVDGENILSWFDLTTDQRLYDAQMKEREREQERLLAQAQATQSEFGLPVVTPTSEEPDIIDMVPVYDPDTGNWIDAVTGLQLTQEQIDEIPITLDTMFSEKPMKMYLVIDFLGR